MTTSHALARALLRALVGCAAVLGIPAAALADQPERANFDARPEGDGTAPAAVERAGDRLRERLGRFGTLSHDPRTDTLRAVGRLDGYLTGPSGRDGAAVALGYVRDNATAFGLDGTDLEGLRLVDREFVDGVEHLAWEQRHRGVPVADAGLEAAVTGSGRLVGLTGPPAADLAVRSVEPDVGARAAYAAARESGGASGAAPAIASVAAGAERTTQLADGGRASLTLFHGASGYRLAWRVLAPVSSSGVYDVLVDARTGVVVRRANLTDFASAKVFEYSPAHGPQVERPLDAWLTGGAAATTLSGPNAHAFVDEHDAVGFDDEAETWNLDPEPGISEVAPGMHDIHPVTAAGCQPALQPGETPAPCTWDPAQTNELHADSWKANKAQSANQLFYFVNKFHDHLENDPDIAFTQDNFERTGQPLGNPELAANPANSDPVLAQALDGAATAGGLPDSDHDNNATFTTLPDGLPGLMEIHLWKPPHFGAYDGANDATLVYHEYTHGLSNRLVKDGQGFGALNTEQAGALGEGWSDFYAMDFLEGQQLEVDQPGVADVHVGSYLDNRTGSLFRWQGLDCTPTTTCTNPSGPADGSGFTYGDFGLIETGGPEVHSDGEIWAQTLWSIRAALIAEYTERLGDDPVAGRAAGIARTREYVTDGMRLAPDEPSFVDARNAILMASPLEEDDEVMWKVFADRGMGYFAGSEGSEDTTPKADFTDTNEFDGVGTLSGTVVDENGAALAGATVGIAGFDTGLGMHSAVTEADGSYSIEDIPTLAGSEYPEVRARKAAFLEDRSDPVEVINEQVGATPPLDFQLTRDFSSAVPAPTAAKVASFTGPNNTNLGCGPGGLIDDDPATVWGSNRDDAGPGADLVGQELVVELAAPIDVGHVAIDPGAGCGDGPTAALGAYEVLGAAAPGGPYESLHTGVFGESAIGTLAPTFSGEKRAIRYIKLHAKTPQGATGSGAEFLDVAELHVARKPGSPIGAAADTGAAQGVGARGATLTGTVVPHGAPPQVVFQYGTTTSYGQTVDASSTGVNSVSAAVGGLQPSTTYHYRVVALRDGREYPGADRTFTTAAEPPAPPITPNPPVNPTPPTNPNPPVDPNPPVAPRPTVLLDARLKARRKGTFKVSVFFGDAAPAGDARFTIIGSKRRRYARATTPVRIGGNVVKTMKLNKRGRKAIRPGRSKRVRLELRLPSGQKLTKSLRLARSRR